MMAERQPPTTHAITASKMRHKRTVTHKALLLEVCSSTTREACIVKTASIRRAVPQGRLIDNSNTAAQKY